MSQDTQESNDLSIAAYERLKILLVSLCFFLALGAYTLVRELGDAVFVSTVGIEWVPVSRMWAMVFLIPLIFVYSKLVDWLTRAQLLSFYAILYGLGGLIFVCFFADPVSGLSNTDASSTRLIGWTFYFFMEGYSVFIVSLVWAFANSITLPNEIKNNYVIITASSKIGGIIFAGAAWWFLCAHVGDRGYCLSGVVAYQILLFIASVALLLIPIVVQYLFWKVPEGYLKGYTVREEGDDHSQQGIFDGLRLVLQYPYVLGIFGMIFFWEITNVIFSYMRLCTGSVSSSSVAEFGAFLFEQVCYAHSVGLLFVLIGTNFFMKVLGERASLLAIPSMIGLVAGVYFGLQSKESLTVAFVLLHAINYSFAYPVRESLYIPTTKAMRFKAKSWIDGFGQKISRLVGSFYNYLMPVPLLIVNILFFTALITVWLVMANGLGRRFERTIAENKVIGQEDEKEA